MTAALTRQAFVIPLGWLANPPPQAVGQTSSSRIRDACISGARTVAMTGRAIMVVGGRGPRGPRGLRGSKSSSGAHALATFNLLELVEFAWHNCHGEITPPDHVVDDILICSRDALIQMHGRQGIKVVPIALATHRLVIDLAIGERVEVSIARMPALAEAAR